MTTLWRQTAVVFGALLFLGAQALSVTAQAPPPPHRVLVVYQTDSTQLALVEIARGLRTGLNGRDPTKFEVYTEFLDSVRFPEEEVLARTTQQMLAKYENVDLDAVVAVGPEPFRLLMDIRGELAPGAPLFFSAITQESLKGQTTPADVKGIASVFDVRQTLDLARQLQPTAREAVIVFGSAPFDKRWEKTARDTVGDSYAGFGVQYLSELSLPQFEDAFRQLSPDSAVIMLTIYEDATGQKFVPAEAAAKLMPQSAAPVYSVYDTYIGIGAIGGQVATFQDIGEQLGSTIYEELEGGSAPQVKTQTTRPIVDWRVLQRFGIKPDLLPQETEIRFRAPSLWDDNWGTILATIAVVLIQTATIVALVIQGRRRRAAEAELATGRTELAHLSRASLLGELSGAFAHELNQPLTSILANTQVARQLLSEGKASVSDLGEILADIEADDRRAASVIAQLRRLLMKGDTVLEPADLNRVAGATMRLVRSELLAKQIRIHLKQSREPVSVLANFAQLQQVLLNMIVNAADATQHLPTSERIVDIAVRKRNKWGELVVTDNGPGISTDMMDDVFKPFVSTKPKGLGLGLSICRSIAKAHGGSLRFDSNYSTGARIILSLPLEGHAHEERGISGPFGG